LKLPWLVGEAHRSKRGPNLYYISLSPGGCAYFQITWGLVLVAGLASAYLRVMGSFWSKVLIPVVAALAVGQSDTALAQNWGVPNIMLDVDANGTPIIMKDSHSRPKKPESENRQSKRAERPRRIPRGSSAYVAPIPLPRTGRDIGSVPAVTPYIPPPIDNPSERIHQLNHSFPLNRGLGLNPTDRDQYIRYNLTR
jgi:hypothetical protein